MTPPEELRALRRGQRLQYATIAWNLMEVFVTIGLGVHRSPRKHP